jgi:hypothetical protein
MKLAKWLGGGAALAYLMSRASSSSAAAPAAPPDVGPAPAPAPNPLPIPQGPPVTPADRVQPDVFPTDQISGSSGSYGWRSRSSVLPSGSYYARCIAPHGCHVHVSPNHAAGTVGVCPFGAAARVIANQPGWVRVRYVDAQRRTIDGWTRAGWWVKTGA